MLCRGRGLYLIAFCWGVGGAEIVSSEISLYSEMVVRGAGNCRGCAPFVRAARVSTPLRVVVCGGRPLVCSGTPLRVVVCGGRPLVCSGTPLRVVVCCGIPLVPLN